MKGPNKVYVDLDQYGAADNVHEYRYLNGDNIVYIREGAIHNIVKDIICEDRDRPLPLSHVRLIEKIIKRIKDL